MAAGVLYKLVDYILHDLLIDEYYTIACSHLLFGIINWANASNVHIDVQN